jgi:hypothetical protein
MADGPRYEIIYDPQVLSHVSKIDKKYHSLIRREIERQLTYQPELETRNRKPLLRVSAFGSAWELRFGPENRFRAFYRTERELRKTYILAIGMKVKERLYIGGKKIDL